MDRFGLGPLRGCNPASVRLAYYTILVYVNTMLEMTLDGSELKAERVRLGMDRHEFGAYLAGLVGADKPYPYTRITDYETGVRNVPAKIEIAFLREQLKQLRAVKEK